MICDILVTHLAYYFAFGDACEGPGSMDLDQCLLVDNAAIEGFPAEAISCACVSVLEVSDGNCICSHWGPGVSSVKAE